ncbi:MAG: ATP-dependent Clp protease ATP-binding subunit [Planctomycetaceae bacterium]|nr:ATP-dependent Clp protease ATP-binding subunit [Planctomycetaceae bacterium]
MRQFLTGNDQDFAGLEQRATGACVAYRDQELPPGSSPSRARVGFEVNPSDESVLLLVDRGIRYTGSSPQVGDWLGRGERRFRSFSDLKIWLRGELAACYGVMAASHSSQELHPSQLDVSPADLTDLDSIRDDLAAINRPVVMDEGELFRELQTHVRGQDAALQTLARRVCRHAARVRPARPASLFALGPTGCGKAKTAEVLPAVLRRLCPNEASYGYLRLDMSEYQERHRISQLLGAPQGYVGYGDGAQLIDTLAANPKTIVLFDEIEKAHSAVFQTLLNAMDAGRLSTPTRTVQGRTVDCRHAIFMFTSNLDSAEILCDLEQRNAFKQPTVVDEVCRRQLRMTGLSPELLGRINAFLIYRALSTDSRAEIVTQAIARGASEYGLNVAQIEPQVVLAILEQAKSNAYGARPDEYLVDDLLGSAFAQAVSSDDSFAVRVTGGPPFGCEAMQ